MRLLLLLLLVGCAGSELHLNAGRTFGMGGGSSAFSNSDDDSMGQGQGHGGSNQLGFSSDDASDVWFGWVGVTFPWGTPEVKVINAHEMRPPLNYIPPSIVIDHQDDIPIPDDILDKVLRIDDWRVILAFSVFLLCLAVLYFARGWVKNLAKKIVAKPETAE